MIGTIFLQIVDKFPKMVPLLLPVLFVIFHHFSEMVPLLSLIFGTFLEWYHFLILSGNFSSFFGNGTIFVSNI